MEFVDSDLKKVLKTVQNGTILSENHVLVILYNLLCAINFIHSAGVMHRDLKPANVLINSDSQIKICDFGIAREVPTAVSNGSIVFQRNNLRASMLDYNIDHESLQFAIYQK